ncbi:MAG: alpha/beta hydrolase [Planctomycetes bacterium]|nr:alpha/beta hydrolase [Planctomycetota bacterium]
MQKLTAVVVLLGAALPAQSVRAPLEGSWQGTAELSGFQLHVALHVTTTDTGRSATLELLGERLAGLVVDELESAGDRVRFRVPWMGARFTGTFETEPRRALRGHWLPGAGRIPIVLEAVSEVRRPQRPQDPHGPTPYRSLDVAIGRTLADGATITLAGTLTLPDRAGPHPAAVLISGSGYQQRDATIRGHRPFLVLADRLTRCGFAVLRYDKRGCGASTGDLAGATSVDLAGDASAALVWLAEQPDVDAQRTGLIGHSEGGMLASMVAAGAEGGQVAFVVSLAGIAARGELATVHQAGRMARVDGFHTADVATLVDLQRRWLTVLGAADFESARRDIAAAARETWDELSDDARRRLGGDVRNLVARGQRFDSPWMRFLVAHDPTADLERVHCPMLALFGSLDVHVDPALHLPASEDALSRGACTDFTVRELAGLNHLFQRCETGAPGEYYGIEQTIAEDVLAILDAWLRERFVETPRPERGRSIRRP